jgi:(heptosyl)LPS beta-1,4-glucosyltransferase
MTDRLPLSILLLARDEAASLAELLPALAFAAEIVVVVDAATRDDTARVATSAGARVLTRALDGFGPQRRFGLAECREPWVLWIDADERLDPGAPAAIAAAIARDDADGFRLARRTWFLGRPIRHCGWGGERVLRLFRRARARFDDALVHERVHVDGVVSELAATLEHLSYPTWDDACRKLLQYSAANAEKLAREGRNVGLIECLVRPPLRFARMYVLQLGVLDGARGWLLCALASTQVFLKYAGRWAGARGLGGGRAGTRGGVGDDGRADAP